MNYLSEKVDWKRLLQSSKALKVFTYSFGESKKTVAEMFTVATIAIFCEKNNLKNNL